MPTDAQRRAHTAALKAALAAANHPHPGLLGALAPGATPPRQGERTAHLTVFNSTGLRRYNDEIGRSSGHFERITGLPESTDDNDLATRVYRNRMQGKEAEARRTMENAARARGGSWRRPRHPQRGNPNGHGQYPPLPSEAVLENAAVPAALVQHLLEEPRGNTKALYMLSLVNKTFRAEVLAQLRPRTNDVTHERGPLKAWMEHVAQMEALTTIERGIVAPVAATFMRYTKDLRQAVDATSKSYWRFVRAMGYLVGLRPAQLYAQFLTASYLVGDFEAPAKQTLYVRARRETAAPISWRVRMNRLNVVEAKPTELEKATESANSAMMDAVIGAANAGAPLPTQFLQAAWDALTAESASMSEAAGFEADAVEVLREPGWWAPRLFTMAKLSSLCHGTDELCGGRGVWRDAYDRQHSYPPNAIAQTNTLLADEFGPLANNGGSILQAVVQPPFAIPQLDDGCRELYRDSEGEKMDRLGFTASSRFYVRQAMDNLQHRPAQYAASSDPDQPPPSDEARLLRRAKCLNYVRCPFFLVNGAPVLSDPATFAALCVPPNDFVDARTAEHPVGALGIATDNSCDPETSRVGPFDVDGALAQETLEFARVLLGRVERRRARAEHGTREMRSGAGANAGDALEAPAPADVQAAIRSVETALFGCFELVPNAMAGVDNRQPPPSWKATVTYDAVQSSEVYAGNLTALSWRRFSRLDGKSNLLSGNSIADRIALGPVPCMWPSSMRRLSDRAVLLLPHPSLPHVESFAEAIGATPVDVAGTRDHVAANSETVQAIQAAVTEVRCSRWLRDADRTVRDQIVDFGFDQLCAALPTLRRAYDAAIEAYAPLDPHNDVFESMMKTKLEGWVRNQYPARRPTLALSQREQQTKREKNLCVDALHAAARARRRRDTKNAGRLDAGSQIKGLYQSVHVCEVPAIETLLQRACAAVTTFAFVEHEATGNTSSGDAYCWMTRLHRGDFRICYDAALQGMSSEERRRILAGEHGGNRRNPGVANEHASCFGCEWRARLDGTKPLRFSDNQAGEPHVSEGWAAGGTAIEVPYLVTAARIFDGLNGGDAAAAEPGRRPWTLRVLLLPCEADDAKGTADGLVTTLQTIERAEEHVRRERVAGKVRHRVGAHKEPAVAATVQRLKGTRCRWTWMLSRTDDPSEWSDPANCVSGIVGARSKEDWTSMYEEMRAQAKKHGIDLGSAAGINARGNSVAWHQHRVNYPASPADRTPSATSTGIACVLHAATKLAPVPQLRALAFHAIGIDPFAVAAQLRARDFDRGGTATRLLQDVGGVAAAGSPASPTGSRGAATAGGDSDVDEAMLFGDGDDGDDAPQAVAGPSGHNDIGRLQALLSAKVADAETAPRRTKRRRAPLEGQGGMPRIRSCGEQQICWGEDDVTDSE